MIYLGTSGFSFKDWVGPFYPPGTPSRDMLGVYARRFSVVELNSTYYRLPHSAVMEGMAARTPESFRFTVKLHGEVTHQRTRDPASMRQFLSVIEPLERAGKFAGALAQFPFSFRATEENRDYLRFLAGESGGRRLIVEFRHDSWARREAFALLDELELGFCAVDEPRLAGLFPPIVRPTGDTGYIRFHGRNAADWWGSEGGDRYNYRYTEQELGEWLAAIQGLAGKSRDTFIFFNNCHAGHAAENAQQMERLLGLSSGRPD